MTMKFFKTHKRSNMYVRKIISKFMRSQSAVQLERNYILINEDRNLSDGPGLYESATCSSSSNQSSQAKGGELRVDEGARNPNIPVTVINVDSDKDMGEANTIQTSSEGYYLKTDWNSGRGSYGAI